MRNKTPIPKLTDPQLQVLCEMAQLDISIGVNDPMEGNPKYTLLKDKDNFEFVHTIQKNTFNSLMKKGFIKKASHDYHIGGLYKIYEISELGVRTALIHLTKDINKGTYQ